VILVVHHRHRLLQQGLVQRPDRLQSRGSRGIGALRVEVIRARGGLDMCLELFHLFFNSQSAQVIPLATLGPHNAPIFTGCLLVHPGDLQRLGDLDRRFQHRLVILFVLTHQLHLCRTDHRHARYQHRHHHQHLSQHGCT
ncbi:MAG: hypothetical protein ACK56I_23805, partial [bacterium]